ncbi:MAG: hypothetical protein J6A01_12465 [Proteobacteria bacterium]|nr:hypothetical protein [Pseudomonadota bacterium]
MKRWIFLVLSCCFLSSCADQTDAKIEDYCSYGSYQNCDLSRDAGECLPGGVCENPTNEKDVYLGKFSANTAADKNRYDDGYLGTIEKKCRLLNVSKYSADSDILEIHTTAGAPLSILISPASKSQILPIGYIYSSNQKKEAEQLLFYDSQNGRAGFFLRAPQDVFYLQVLETYNESMFGKDQCSDSDIYGGDNYRYVVQISDAEIEIKDLGNIGKQRTESNRFTRMGEVHYYMVKAGPDGLKFSFDSGHSTVLSPLLYNSDTPENWSWSGEKLNPNRNEQINGYIDSKYADCSVDECTYGFAVSDYLGDTDYSYKMTIEAL